MNSGLLPVLGGLKVCLFRPVLAASLIRVGFQPGRPARRWSQEDDFVVVEGQKVRGCQAENEQLL